MKASQVLAAGALVAPALAQNRTEIVTITDTAYTTYCPVPTTIPIGNMTYTVSKATTLTITNCPCTLTKTGWFKPTATATAQPVCPGGEDCGHGGNDGGNNGGDHECDGKDCGSNGGNPGGNGGNGGGSECNGKDCGNNGGNGGNPGGNGVNPGGNGGNNGNNGGNECNGKDCGNNGVNPGSNGGNPGSNGGNPGSNGGNNGNNGGSGNPTPAPQGGCDEKTGAGCPAVQTATGAQPTGTSAVVAGANVNGLSAGAMVVAGFAAMML
ncbi:hypothetical protein VB005_02008 [Metarhizium brunneum]